MPISHTQLALLQTEGLKEALRRGVGGPVGVPAELVSAISGNSFVDQSGQDRHQAGQGHLVSTCIPHIRQQKVVVSRQSLY